MTDATLDDEDDRGPRVMSNWQVLGFIARRWVAQPRRFVLLVTLFLIGAGCELMIPWAAGRLVNSVSGAQRIAAVAWRAWASLSVLYVFYYACRQIAFRNMAHFSSKAMEIIARNGFQRVQAFSSDWHASTFAGATVRKLTRAIWGFDQATDAVILALTPTIIVLGGLSATIAVRWPLIGLFVGGVVAAFITLQLTVIRAYIRPANLKSNALDTRIGASLADAIGANPAVKSFGAEAREEARFGAVASQWQRAVVVTWNRFNTLAFASNILMVTLQAGLTGLMIWRWAAGNAGPGDVAFAITAFMLMQQLPAELRRDHAHAAAGPGRRAGCRPVPQHRAAAGRPQGRARIHRSDGRDRL